MEKKGRIKQQTDNQTNGNKKEISLNPLLCFGNIMGKRENVGKLKMRVEGGRERERERERERSK